VAAFFFSSSSSLPEREKQEGCLVKNMAGYGFSRIPPFSFRNSRRFHQISHISLPCLHVIEHFVSQDVQGIYIASNFRPSTTSPKNHCSCHNAFAELFARTDSSHPLVLPHIQSIVIIIDNSINTSLVEQHHTVWNSRVFILQPTR
jgi:hypothetical protein